MTIIARQPASGRAARTRFDTTTILTIYLVLLWSIPSPMVVPALGSAGSPSTVLAITIFFCWAWLVVRRTEPTLSGRQPVRTCMLGWLLIMLVVYAHATARPLPTDEISVADSGLLRLIGFAGLVLLATDGITSVARHRQILHRLAIAAGLVAVLGLIQYATGELYVDRVRVLGLTAGTSEWTLGSRFGFVRPSGTSTSPIEYGVVLAMALPLMIAFALSTSRRRWLFRIMLVAMIASIFFSMSRSAYLCSLTGLVVLGMSWDLRTRLRALALLGMVSTVMYVSVPGLLGAILGLFSNAGQDPSIGSRTGSYEIAGGFVANSPVIGRGFGTFLPKYWILDNAYLGLLVEAGLIGLLGLAALLVAAITSARQARDSLSDEEDRQVAQALLASVAAGAAGLAFFDALAFPQTAGCFFLLVGLAGAHRRLTREQAQELLTRPLATG